MGDMFLLIIVFLCIVLLIFWCRYCFMYKLIKGLGKCILWLLLFLILGIVWFLSFVYLVIL